jgi:hypothetical protein
MLFEFLLEKSYLKQNENVLISFNEDLSLKNEFTIEIKNFIKEKYLSNIQNEELINEMFALSQSFFNTLKENKELFENVYKIINEIYIELNLSKNEIINLINDVYLEHKFNKKINYYKLFLIANSVDDLLRFFAIIISRIELLNISEFELPTITETQKSINKIMYNEMILSNKTKIIELFKDVFLIKDVLEKSKKTKNQKNKIENIFFINVDKSLIKNKKEIIDYFIDEYHNILNNSEVLKTKIETNIMCSFKKDDKIYVYKFAENKKDILNDMLNLTIEEENYEKATVIKKILDSINELK